MTQAAASTTIGGAALPVGSVTQAYSWTVAFGSVISESPAAGTQVGPGIAVALTISEGPQPVTVPNVVALAQAAASASIIGAGLALGIVTQAYSSTVPVGSVISQSPTSGMAVLPGFIVALTISKGPQPVSVPDVVGLTQTAADTAIAKALLTLGTVTQVYSVRVPAGEVVGQAPPAGTIATPGTAVDLDVSERPQPVNIEMVLVPSGTFTMGNSGVGDDTMGWSDESPGHLVTLNAYQSGKYDVTNKQYCGVLNWALAQGYLMDNAGVPWAGTGDIFAGGNLQILLSCTDTDCNIEYLGGVFSSKTRTGLPGTTVYSMDTHPVVMVSWYGAAAFCNWLSEMQGLTPCYDMTAVDWPLVVAPPKQGGYRLPTEAEWERAAAWDGAKHWIYGFMSDTNAGNNRCNDQWRRVSATWIYVNPLGLTTYPYTSPVDWFNGLNVSPNGTVATVNSVSPVGAYDMSGNVWQWCDDGPESYNSGTQTNPLGPTSGSARVRRGGGWSGPAYNCRTADRSDNLPMHTFNYVGFRLAKS
jgi:formylglycine-generating enzyme required for sulfatase activity